VVRLEEEARVHEAQVDGLVNSVDELRATINSMMDRLCHCSEGKGKEREVVVKIEEESEELEYASEDEYRTAPGTGEVMVTELVPLEQDPEGGVIAHAFMDNFHFLFFLKRTISYLSSSSFHSLSHFKDFPKHDSYCW